MPSGGFLAIVFSSLVGLLQQVPLAFGVWLPSMVRRHAIARTASRYDDDPHDDRNYHLEVIQVESMGFGLLWYMIPGMAVFGKFIECMMPAVALGAWARRSDPG